jgi:hypothetical protein
MSSSPTATSCCRCSLSLGRRLGAAAATDAGVLSEWRTERAGLLLGGRLDGVVVAALGLVGDAKG